MSSAFTVIDEFTLIFHTRISGLRVELNEETAHRISSSSVYLSLNFDNFRSYETEYCSPSRTPSWETEKMFNYETVYADQLKHKLFQISLFQRESKTEIGMAMIDLLSVATGPWNISLTMFPRKSTRSARDIELDTSNPIGTVHLQCQMNELRESLFTPLRLQIKARPELLQRFGILHNVVLQYSTRSYRDGYQSTWRFNIENDSMLQLTDGRAKQQLRPLYMGGTLYSFVEDQIYFTLCSASGDGIAQGSMSLAFDDADFTMDNCNNLRAGACCTLRRTVPLVALESLDTQTVLRPLGDLVIDAKLSDLPRHAQMAGGHNVDGNLIQTFSMKLIQCLSGDSLREANAEKPLKDHQ